MRRETGPPGVGRRTPLHRGRARRGDPPANAAHAPPTPLITEGGEQTETKGTYRASWAAGQTQLQQQAQLVLAAAVGRPPAQAAAPSAAMTAPSAAARGPAPLAAP